ncbi:sugar phosphate isomerase/epimerase family protein [Lactiplantibacillus pentosus]|uniref:sugar phosphate isomerase/epimerase family protein n=1 Tax=Lactiplantibacillus pentosus TaxID=1589 RepID=UPI003C2A378D
MQVGINTAVYEDEVKAGVSQLDCIKTLVGRNEIGAVEVRGEFFKPTTKDTELAAISQLCRDNHWDLYYSVPEELFGPNGYNASLQTNLDMATKYQIKSLKYSLGKVSLMASSTLSQLRQLLMSSQTQVTIENQPNDNGQLGVVETALEWIKQQQLPLGYTFDSGNWYWIDQQPEPAFTTLKSAITVFHLKDIKNQNTMMLGDGDTDWQQLLKALPETTPVFIEYNIQSQNLPEQIALVQQALS